MASIFDQAPVYLTITEVKDSTQKASLKTLTDSQIKSLIYRAQLAVDGYVKTYPKYPKYDPDQQWLFPIMVNGVETIPTEVKIATLYIIEQMHVNGDVITADQKIKRETTGPHSVEYASTSVTYIPDDALRLLDLYRTSVFANII